MKKRIIVLLIIVVIVEITVSTLKFNAMKNNGDKNPTNLIMRYWKAFPDDIDGMNKCLYGKDKIKEPIFISKTGCFMTTGTPKIKYETDYMYMFDHIYVYDFSIERISFCKSKATPLNKKIKLIKKYNKYYIYDVPYLR